MNTRFLATILTSLAVAVSATTIINRPSQASTNTYYCAQLNGTWGTQVNTPRGRVTLINWVNSFSDEWTAQKRCMEVSGRFQKYLSDGSLKYIRTGNINQQPVICVAASKGGACPDTNVLITLEPHSNPEEVLIKLIDFRRSVSGNTIVLSDDIASYQDREFYVDINNFLNNVPIEE
jgi:hypothetical protein